MFELIVNVRFNVTDSKRKGLYKRILCTSVYSYLGNSICKVISLLGSIMY